MTKKYIWYFIPLLIFIVYFILLVGFCPKAKAQDFSIILGEQETTYAFKIKEKRNRATNIELAASKIDGIILQPNEIFSYNKLVGERTEENGFKEAPEIINSELVDGIGGGICQVAGTTHSAMLHSGMIVMESRQHSRHSVYIDPGLDSTVSWPFLDLKMKNSYPFPIKVVAATYRDKNKGHLIIRIMGKEQLYKTEIINKIFEKEKYETQKTFSDEYFEGFVKVIEPGTFKIKMTRTVKIFSLKTNSLLLEEARNLYYNPSDRILLIGTRPKEPK